MKKTLLEHYIRQVIAFHVFTIFQMFGLRVLPPVSIAEGNKKFAEMLNNDFLSVKALQKTLPDGCHTSTNVAWILTIIALMIKKGDVKISINNTSEGLSSLFNARDGYLLSIKEGIANARTAGTQIKQDDLWYLKHVGILFTWVNSRSGKDTAVDLVDLFQAVVFGVNPFFDVNNSKEPQTSKKEQARENKKLYEDHFSRVYCLMKWLKKEDVVEKLVITDRGMNKPTEKKKHRGGTN
jgi:hypothetical protein